ncbi:ParA family protein [Vibrio vulnificus]|uniref:ParA family protein n=1 Tax=Vibrio vulnificus TaxID=672 RepID=UPI0010326017|nr:ParA family protein [Vibrio vulnificus]
MKVFGIYSEAGGVTKTNTAVSLAVEAALLGHKVTLIDIDPRAAATKWAQLEVQDGLHVGAILASDACEGWVEELAVPSPWAKNLRILPSSRNVSNREADVTDGLEFRLKRSLLGNTSDLVFIDMPNRQGGPIIKAALTAMDAIIYAAKLDGDGIDGVLGARQTVAKFNANMDLIGSSKRVNEVGIIAGAISTTIIPAVEKAAFEDLDATGLLLKPMIPKRTIVQQTRLTGEWFGNYRAGRPVSDAYRELLQKEVLR